MIDTKPDRRCSYLNEGLDKQAVDAVYRARDNMAENLNTWDFREEWMGFNTSGKLSANG